MPWDRFAVASVDVRTRRGFHRLGHLVRRRRQRIGLSQRQLESLSGVDQTVISRHENGCLVSLRWSRFAKLVEAMGGLSEDDPDPAWAGRLMPPGWG